MTFKINFTPQNQIAQSAGAVEYTDYPSAEGLDPPQRES